MAINKRLLQLEIEKKLPGDAELQRKSKEFAEDVRDHARRQALMDMDKGYATGAFVESIQIKRIRRRRLPDWKVFSDDPKANLLEYGTGPDNPDSKSPWGPNTPTPEYATFGKTALHFGGTPDSVSAPSIVHEAKGRGSKFRDAITGRFTRKP